MGDALPRMRVAVVQAGQLVVFPGAFVPAYPAAPVFGPAFASEQPLDVASRYDRPDTLRLTTPD